jgi:hypothetical protein
MKLMNLSAHDPEFVASGRKGLPRGNRLEAEVWQDFGSDRQRLHTGAVVPLAPNMLLRFALRENHPQLLPQLRVVQDVISAPLTCF